MVGAVLNRPFFRTLDRGEALRTAALFAILLVATFRNVVFQGESLLPGDNFNPVGMACTPENHGPGSHPQRYFDAAGTVPWANVHDPGGPWWQSEPGTELLKRALRRGEFPLWDPYVGGGAPAMANLLPSYFFPPVLAIAFLGNEPWLKNFYILAQLLAAGFFTYVFLRKHGLSALASRAGGIAFLFSGAVVQTVPGFVGQPVVGMPLILATAAWLLHKPSWRRTSVTAVAFAFVALASFPPVLVLAFGITVLYAATVIWLDPEQAGRRVLITRFAIAALLSLGLVAFYYLPAFYLIRQSQFPAVFYRDAGLHHLETQDVFQLLSPRLLSGAPIYPNIPPAEHNLFYFGVTGLLLALIALGRARPLPLLLFQIAGLLLFMKIFGIPPIQWIGRLPVFNAIHFSWYGGMLLGFCLAVSAAMAIELLSQEQMRRWAIVVAAIVILGVFLQLALSVNLDMNPNASRWWSEFRLQIVFLVIAASLLYARRDFAAIAVVVLLVIEGMHHASFPRQKRWNYWDHPPRFVQHLLAQPALGRVLPIGFFTANTNSPFAIGSVDSLFMFNSDRYAELHHLSFRSPVEPALRESRTIPPDAVLDAFAVDRLVLWAGDGTRLTEALRRGFTRTYGDSNAIVLRRASAPRYFVTRDYAVMTPRAALNGLPDRPPHRLLLEHAPGFAPDPNDRAGTVQVDQFGLNGYRLRTFSARPALLSTSETDFPGWTARVNGKETPILAANYAFRAIEIPAGTSTIEFSYWPPGMTVGLVISAIALLIAVIMALK